jgi:GrpB-like predicted nucleotidyltransferase (UPF0157 family)
MKTENDLTRNIDKIHTTERGAERIIRNLGLTSGLKSDEAVSFCKRIIGRADEITRSGKNWYVFAGGAVITVNARSYTVITAHKNKPKELSEISDAERAKLFPVILAGYNPDWALWYEAEKEDIKKRAGKSLVSVSHIGSTAVSGLTAKPTIDILLEVCGDADIEKLKAAFPSPQYVCLDRQTVPTNDILLFLKGYKKTGFADKVFHIHVRYEGGHDELIFRDYLKQNEEAKRQYAELKAALQKRFEFDRDGYTAAKTEFIKAALNRAREIKK